MKAKCNHNGCEKKAVFVSISDKDGIVAKLCRIHVGSKKYREECTKAGISFIKIK